MFSYIKGLLDCFGGFALIIKPGIKRYVLAPLLVNIALFGGAIWLLHEQMQSWIEQAIADRRKTQYDSRAKPSRDSRV